MVSALVVPFPHLWLGVSVEDQRRADERIPDLLATPAAVRWISAEPLLGPIDLRAYLLSVRGKHGQRVPLPMFDSEDGRSPRRGYLDQAIGLDWVVVGGESGPGARPMHPDWTRSLRDQCQAARVPFFFKQWGEWTPPPPDRQPSIGMASGGDCAWPDGTVGAGCKEDNGGLGYFLWRIGKRAAGRLLDGREWNECATGRGQ